MVGGGEEKENLVEGLLEEEDGESVKIMKKNVILNLNCFSIVMGFESISQHCVFPSHERTSVENYVLL